MHSFQAASAAGVDATEQWRPPSYWPFVLPAMIVVLAVIVFPWAFTVWMSMHEWKVGQPIQLKVDAVQHCG